MREIRLMGAEQEVQQAVTQMRKLKGLKILREPSLRRNREDQGIRIYLDVEFTANSPKKKKPKDLDKSLEEVARSLQFLIYADGHKIRAILNAANSFDWGVSTKDMDLDQFLKAVAVNLHAVASVQHLDIETAEAADAGFPMVRHSSSYQEEYHLNQVHTLVNRYPQAGECQALIDLLAMHGRA